MVQALPERGFSRLFNNPIPALTFKLSVFSKYFVGCEVSWLRKNGPPFRQYKKPNKIENVISTSPGYSSFA